MHLNAALPSHGPTNTHYLEGAYLLISIVNGDPSGVFGVPGPKLGQG